MNVKSTLISLISFILIICFLGHQVLAKKGGSNIVIGGGGGGGSTIVSGGGKKGKGTNIVITESKKSCCQCKGSKMMVMPMHIPMHGWGGGSSWW